MSNYIILAGIKYRIIIEASRCVIQGEHFLSLVTKFGNFKEKKWKLLFFRDFLKLFIYGGEMLRLNCFIIKI